MRSMDGFGISKELVEENRNGNPEIDSVEIHYGDKIYSAPLSLFKDSGIYYHRHPYEPQYILPRSKFSIKDPKQTELV